MTKSTFKWWMYPLVPLGLLWFLLLVVPTYPFVYGSAWCVVWFCEVYDIDEPDWAWLIAKGP